MWKLNHWISVLDRNFDTACDMLLYHHDIIRSDTSHVWSGCVQEIEWKMHIRNLLFEMTWHPAWHSVTTFSICLWTRIQRESDYFTSLTWLVLVSWRDYSIIYLCILWNLKWAIWMKNNCIIFKSISQVDSTFSALEHCPIVLPCSIGLHICNVMLHLPNFYMNIYLGLVWFVWERVCGWFVCACVSRTVFLC